MIKQIALIALALSLIACVKAPVQDSSSPTDKQVAKVYPEGSLQFDWEEGKHRQKSERIAPTKLDYTPSTKYAEFPIVR